MSRSAEDIRWSWLTEFLPSGKAWSRSISSNLAGLLMAAALVRARTESDIEALLLEISPGTSTLLLSDYQNVLGPDPLGRDRGNLTQAQTQRLLQLRWVARGGQSIAFYKALAASFGVEIEIYEPSPSVYGTFVWGDGSVFSSDVNDNFVWQVTLPSGDTGLEGAINRNRQSDTVVVFRYLQATSGAALGQFLLGVNALGDA